MAQFLKLHELQGLRGQMLRILTLVGLCGLSRLLYLYSSEVKRALLAYKKGGEQWCLIMVGEEGGQGRLEKVGASMHGSLSNISSVGR